MPAATLTGYEALSRPFRYVLEYYPDEQPELAALIGKPYTVRLPMPDGARGSCALIRNAPALSSKI